MPDRRTLRLKRADGAPQFEQYMRATQHGDTSLRIPNTLTAAASLGRSASLTQLIATWAQNSSSRQLSTYLPADDRTAHAAFVSRLHGLAAAYFADQVKAVDQLTDIRQPLLQAAVPRIHAMSTRQFQSAGKGTQAELLFVHGAKRQFHSAVYSRPPTFAERMDPQHHGECIVSAQQMSALVRNILRTLNLPSKDFERIAPLLEPRTAPLGSLLHETFRNTAEHAYLDTDGRVPSRGLRCILIATRHTHPRELSPEALVSAKHPGLDRYFDLLRRRVSRLGRRLVFMLELSVLDTGPGFAATMRQPAGAGDLRRIAECFVDYASSKPGPNSGLGLGRVLRQVSDLNGFVRFRTSTGEAFFAGATASPDSTTLPHIAGDLPNAVGTVLTIGIPLSL